ncbi:MAG: fluoride efflux transporter CrcB [Rhodoferax sp.]
MLNTVLPISLGAALGALLRWFLGLRLNGWFALMPPGTLAANWLGAYLMGLAMAYFSLHTDLPPQWRLGIVTGFLGALTTFSTFSAEVVTQLQQGHWGWALATVASHVIGSVLLTVLGFVTVMALRG